jgi:hypothetical protein
LRGSFLLSEESVALLDELQKERKRVAYEIEYELGTGPDIFYAEEELMRKYFAKFREVAKKDLGVNETL